MIDKLIPEIKNIKGGPVSTFIGVVLFIMGSIMVYKTYKSESPLLWTSVEAGVFALGIFFLVISDEWIKKSIKKKDDQSEPR